MDFIAVIDANGNAFIGQHGRDEAWVFEGHSIPVEPVLNERGHLPPSIEDIEWAYMEHKPAGTSAHFVDDETMTAYINGTAL